MLVDSIATYKRMLSMLEDLGGMYSCDHFNQLCSGRFRMISYSIRMISTVIADTCGFKTSAQKRDPDLQMLLCNLHVQKLRVQELFPDGNYSRLF